MKIKYYNSLDERKIILDEANSLGESMIHDDFLDSDDKPTDGTKGKLSLDIISNVIDPKFIREKELIEKLKNDTMTFSELKEYLRLGT